MSANGMRVITRICNFQLRRQINPGMILWRVRALGCRQQRIDFLVYLL